METFSRAGFPFRPSLQLILLLAILAVLWIAGGASREDAMGQPLVRAACALILVAAALFGKKISFRGVKPIFFLLSAAVLLAILQLIPLPPGMWQALPGRHLLIETAQLTGTGQPWRPLSLVPGATANAAASLIVPATVLILVSGLSSADRSWLPGSILIFIVMSMFIGLLQFSGIVLNNPFINDTPGQVAGSFANRNHFALLLALGCLLAPVWVYHDAHQSRWRGIVAFGLVLLFALTILASGSRTGLILGALALGIGLLLVRQSIRRTLRRYPRWAFPALIGGVAGAIAIFVLISFVADRAASISRVLTVDVGQDLRARALPTVLAMIRDYFPFGSGLGGFDPVFRIHEPFELLNFTYLNHAHNDLLEVVLDAGLPGLLLIAAALLWWGWASVRAWRGPDTRNMLPRLGSAMLLLIVIASAFDYPARTPAIMAIIVVAGVWLSSTDDQRGRSALPQADQPL